MTDKTNIIERGNTFIEEPVERTRRGILSMIIIAVMLIIAGLRWSLTEASMGFFWILIAVVISPALWIWPTRIGIRDGEFYIKRLFRTKVIPLDRIARVQPFVPSPADGRIWAYNVAGRLGWFKNWEKGLYFAYIGNTDQAFIIELKPEADGRVRRYACSCRNQEAMMRAISEAIND